MKILNRVILYLVGLVFLALGTITSIWSDLGVAATTSAGYALSVITGKSLGTFTMIFFGAFIMIQILMNPKEKKIPVLWQIPASLFFPWLIDFFNSLMHYEISGMLPRVLCLLASFVITGIGAYFTIKTDIAPTPPDGLVGSISEIINKPLGAVKNVFDIINVLLAVILLLIFVHGIPGIGIGTVLCSLAVGRILDFCVKHFDGYMEKLRE